MSRYEPKKGRSNPNNSVTPTLCPLPGRQLWGIAWLGWVENLWKSQHIQHMNLKWVQQVGKSQLNFRKADWLTTDCVSFYDIFVCILYHFRHQQLASMFAQTCAPFPALSQLWRAPRSTRNTRKQTSHEMLSLSVHTMDEVHRDGHAFQIPRCLSPERREVSANLCGKRYCAGSNSRFGQPLQWGGRAFQRYRYMGTYLRIHVQSYSIQSCSTSNWESLDLVIGGWWLCWIFCNCRLRPAAAVHGYSMLAKVSGCNPQFLMFSVYTCVQGSVSVFRSRSVKMETPPKRIRTEAIWGTFYGSSFTDWSLW